MRETELLRHIFERSEALPGKHPQVLAGPGHDCAVVRIGSDVCLLKVDQLVAGRHFRDDAPIELIARKAVARAVSDIAAAGGMPRAALAAATLPSGYKDADALFDAMARWGSYWDCPLVGGDIASGGALVLSVSIVGVPHPPRGPVLRSGARPGDGVYVTGALGGSFDAASGLGRHFTFEPRLREAAFLCEKLGSSLHAMMDVSDGLGRDAGRLAAMSGVRIELEESLIPCAPGVASWRNALGDGEDYELFFAAAGAVPAMAGETGTRITRIGTVAPGSGVILRLTSGAAVDVSEIGWEHRS